MNDGVHLNANEWSVRASERLPKDATNPNPPTEKARERRDMEWLRIAQLRFVEGYRARLAELHPMKRDRNGDRTQQREPKWSYAELGETRSVPHNVVIPAHERERWLAGWAHADGICMTRGLTAAKGADPAKAKRTKPAVVAEQPEAFPDAVLSRKDARAHRARQERIQSGHAAEMAPTLPDAEMA